MKRTILGITLILLSTIATLAQDITTKIGIESNEISIGQMLTSKIIDAKNNQILFITNKKKQQSPNSEYKYSDYMLINADTNLCIKSSLVLKNTKNCELLAENATNNSIRLLLRERQRNEDIIKRIDLDRESLTIQNETPIYTIKHSRKETLYIWCKSSPNTDYTSITYIIDNPNKDKWDCHSIMLNKGMDIMWNLQPSSYAINDIFVTDDATLYLVGNHYSIEKGTTDFYYERLSEKTHNVISRTHNNILIDSYILNVIDSNIIITGNTYYQDSPKNEIQFGGLYGMSFDFNTKNALFEMHEYNHEELCVLYNEDITKSKIPEFIDNIQIYHLQPTPNGGIMTAQRQITEFDVDMNDKTKTVYTNMGLIAMKIDQDGHINWTRAFRHKQEQINGTHYLHHCLFTNGDMTYILQSENSQSPQTYNNNEAIKTLSPTIKKANTAMYSIDIDGNVTKQILTTNEKSAIYGSGNKWYNDHCYYFIGKGKKCNIIDITR